ncbi:MAG: 3-hydroxy-3-methylglutaryl-CoA reductase, partial [Anaerolineales bacterium]|nr:3-hydroxy-3-methylglutaryl-CoA reductase [Anaerolineales bacterium]MDW8447446.1 3-hydroxy-3-methylglutaryl-CoA reductase [Anaerolineales bacterium]
MDTLRSSRLVGFYNLSVPERQQQLFQQGWLEEDDLGILTDHAGLSLELADHMIENVVGVHPLPLGIATNFIINGREVLVPMAIEEPSVVAGASYMAKLARSTGGFQAQADPPLMIGQMQIIELKNPYFARHRLLAEKQALLAEAAKVDPVLNSLGGGPKDIEVRIIENSPIGAYLVLHLIIDVCDAMGANVVNTTVERIAPLVESISGGKVHLRILSNLADKRLARAACVIPVEQLQQGDLRGEEVRDGI